MRKTLKYLGEKLLPWAIVMDSVIISVLIFIYGQKNDIAIVLSMFSVLIAFLPMLLSTSYNRSTTLEARKINKISYENQLKKEKIEFILNGINKVGSTLLDLRKQLTLDLREYEIRHQLNSLEIILQYYIDCLENFRDYELENALPSLFDRSFPEIINFRSTLKNRLTQNVIKLKEIRNKIHYEEKNSIAIKIIHPYHFENMYWDMEKEFTKKAKYYYIDIDLCFTELKQMKTFFLNKRFSLETYTIMSVTSPYDDAIS